MKILFWRYLLHCGKSAYIGSVFGGVVALDLPLLTGVESA